MSPFDLHAHSTVSDGTLRPSALVERAVARGIDVLALTDHDDTAGTAEAVEAAAGSTLRVVAGVEISVTWESRTLHILGLNVDPCNAALAAGLAHIREGRDARAARIAESFAKAGIRGTLEGAKTHVTSGRLISRTHFARFLVEQGHCRDTSEVFRKYLTEGKPGYVPHRWASLKDAVQWITAAKGMAVIAHPGRYKFTANEEYALFLEFKAHGGRAIEVVTGSHTTAEYVEYADKALEFDFAASRGSDFHSPGESHCDLGKLPPLPGALTPVWELLSDRIQQ